MSRRDCHATETVVVMVLTACAVLLAAGLVLALVGPR